MARLCLCCGNGGGVDPPSGCTLPCTDYPVTYRIDFSAILNGTCLDCETIFASYIDVVIYLIDFPSCKWFIEINDYWCSMQGSSLDAVINYNPGGDFWRVVIRYYDNFMQYMQVEWRCSNDDFDCDGTSTFNFFQSIRDGVPQPSHDGYCEWDVDVIVTAL